ncbi:MAG TPA: plastocyanin/azurin family copper-binding protein [Gemmatimonadaceae bacterium]|nr:plastocyanin/azurin family copper-binding protein [Gemmatimonadaceae bacterium]
MCYLASTFSPKSITVSKGTTVSFVNNSGIEHNTIFDGTRSPGVDDIPANTSGTFTREFTTAGRFAFHCSFHAGMTGEVVVQ